MGNEMKGVAQDKDLAQELIVVAKKFGSDTKTVRDAYFVFLRSSFAPLN